MDSPQTGKANVLREITNGHPPQTNDMLLNEQKIRLLEKEILELKTALDLSHDGFVITAASGIVLYCNSAVERLTGIKKEHLLGHNLNNLVKQGIILKEPASFKALREKKIATTFQHYHTGKKSLITATPLFNEAGKITKLISNLRDISELEDLHEKLERSLTVSSGYINELQELRAKMFSDVVFKSNKMDKVLEVAIRVALTDCTVLILGETGVGKEVVARIIHQSSKRGTHGPFIKVNCGAIPHHLLESELFGYEKGAFTGAKSEGKAGLFELANEGTIFLDEIAEMSLELQAKLLRVLQEREILRLGSIRPTKLNIRVLAATNKNLKSLSEQGRFRQDLYYRLSVVPLEIPPLRERTEDIPPLLSHFLEKFSKQYEKQITCSNEAFKYLLDYAWPGNVRELANLLERLVITSNGKRILPEDLPEYVTQEDNSSYLNRLKNHTLKEALEIFEKDLIVHTFKSCSSTYQAAELLGVSQSTVSRRVKKYLGGKIPMSND